jgi:hypothetical protein
MELPDFGWFDAIWKQGWPVVKGAPLQFFLAALFFGVIAWLLARWQYKERIDGLRESRDRYKEKADALASRRLASADEHPLPDGREVWSNPRFKLVTGRNYINETIEIDGKSFRDCSFEHVTLMFRGIAPSEMIGTNRISGGLSVNTDHPAAMLYSSLQRFARSVPGARVIEGAVDPKGNVLPDKFEFAKIGGMTEEQTPTSPAVTPQVIVIRAEQSGDGMTPQTNLSLKNVGKEVAQKVTVKPFSLSGKRVSFTQLAVLALDAEQSISPRIEGVETVFAKRDLLDALFGEWANADPTQKEFAVRTAVQFENLNGIAFEVPFDLVYCAYVHRLYKISLNERSKREMVLIEARNFGPVKPLS